MREQRYFVYIMASRRNGTLYIGLTNNIARRAFEHASGAVPGFTKKHDVKLLVHFEVFDSIELAMQREKSLKRYPRKWKLNLIESTNPTWNDLTRDLNNLI
ncbi:MAG: GIY-YIG nuclease family protein [Alphaproteobacteria bacterium]